MRLRTLAYAVATMIAVPAMAEASAPVMLPSGLAAQLHQVIWPEAGAAKGQRRLRYRFVAPGIGGADPEAASDDLQYLCDRVALPALRADGRAADEIVITLMARPVPFGTSAPGVKQFIDAFLPAGDHCEWEGL